MCDKSLSVERVNKSAMYNYKTATGFGFCDILNDQALGKYISLASIISDITKTSSSNSLLYVMLNIYILKSVFDT